MAPHTSRTTQPLKSLVYSSEAVEHFDDTALEQLLRSARNHNWDANITGALFYRDGSFIQFLEGAPADVDALMERIQNDSRHTNVRIVVDELTTVRQFSDWTMGYQPLIGFSGQTPVGFHDSFADLERAPDRFTTGRAAKELALWFRVRAGAALTAGAIR